MCSRSQYSFRLTAFEQPFSTPSSFETIARHHVVPACYRALFPEHMKSHLSHDIVLLCAGSCHARANVVYQHKMKELGELYNAPLADEAKKFVMDTETGIARASARALLKAGPKLPPAAGAHHEGTLRRYLGLSDGDALSDSQLEATASLEARRPAEGWVSHAERVVAALAAAGGEAALEQFVRDWRMYFLEALEPKHLPESWSVDARAFNSLLPGQAKLKPRVLLGGRGGGEGGLASAAS